MAEKASDAFKNIQTAVEDIRALITLAFHDKLVEKKELLREGSVKKDIYELCDGTRTREEIGRALKKSADYVSSCLTRLRREGLIHAVEKEGKEVYEQVF
jgi:DNA-binding transcriptional ArsR family regulator